MIEIPDISWEYDPKQYREESWKVLAIIDKTKFKKGLYKVTFNPYNEDGDCGYKSFKWDLSIDQFIYYTFLELGIDFKVQLIKTYKNTIITKAYSSKLPNGSEITIGKAMKCPTCGQAVYTSIIYDLYLKPDFESPRKRMFCSEKCENKAQTEKGKIVSTFGWAESYRRFNYVRVPQ